MQSEARWGKGGPFHIYLWTSELFAVNQDRELEAAEASPKGVAVKKKANSIAGYLERIR